MTASTGDSRDQHEQAEIATVPGAIPSDSFAARLILTRHHNGHLSIREAADMCGLGRGAWTNWERGARPSDVQIYTIIADKMGMNLEWLMFGGALLPARGRPTKRVRDLTPEYLSSAVRLTGSKPIDLSATASSSRPDRRPRMVDRAQPAAA